jgi:hypothetical protein
MSRTKYFDRDGKEISQTEWLKLIDDSEYSRVALDNLNGVKVSTVWLGWDHGWGYEEKPLIFETMVFEGELDQYMERFATEQEAKDGHKSAMEMVLKSQTDDKDKAIAATKMARLEKINAEMRNDWKLIGWVAGQHSKEERTKAQMQYDLWCIAKIAGSYTTGEDDNDG